jgi:hypothetical protein
MQSSHLPRLLAGSLLTCGVLISASPALAATPAFTITATSVTMSSSAADGVGLNTFTLTSVNGYTGTMEVHCEPPTPPPGAKIPYCGGGAVSGAFTLTANQVATGHMNFDNAPVPQPAAGMSSRAVLRMVPGVALAGLLLFGFGIRRRSAHWLRLTLVAVGSLGTLAVISACGGNQNYVTPGAYQYTMTATDINSAASVSSSFNVSVP